MTIPNNDYKKENRSYLSHSIPQKNTNIIIILMMIQSQTEQINYI